MGDGRPDPSFPRSFPRACRLASSDDYRRVYQSSWRGRSGPLTWRARSNQLTFARLGMAVPKRVVKKATDRSRIKRLIRESFRQNRSRLPCVDIVVSVTASPGNLYGPELVQRIDDIWTKLLSSVGKAT